jgi:hypothetical protein
MDTRRHPDPHRPQGLDLAGAIGACIDAAWRFLLRILARVGSLTVR